MYGDVPRGFMATIFIIIFFSGIQLFFMGIMGEYLLRIFFQVKGRPLFIVKDEIEEGEWIKWWPQFYDFDDIYHYNIWLHARLSPISYAMKTGVRTWGKSFEVNPIFSFV